ncbi:MAG: hypothetical protein Gaeavirus4_18 [Gaeavirus sp.]|uniref:Uncharacterized protein n=1 Tax=Gaeavirus sp. TaxID=2487767 RepID=A0A3G4ZYJ5_9VIRU|nr:MAG: hypothetical protein Gaeavirus4_18 [Gaeavirus sp.]
MSDSKQRGKNLGIVNEPKMILEKSNELYQDSKKEYYDEVLEFLNLLFNSESVSIMKLKIKTITLNEIIFDTYNDIVKKYKLKNFFNKDAFDVEEEHEQTLVIDIAKNMTNNLLATLKYKLTLQTWGNVKKFRIIIDNNGF